MTTLHRQFAYGMAVLVFLAAAAVATAQTTATVFVPGNTLGDFGNPSVDGAQPYLAVIAATGPGTITVTYLSGLVTDCCPQLSTGPNGTPFNFGTGQSPLQEAAAVSGGEIPNLDALIGAFVPQCRVKFPGFQAVDGAKNIARIGLFPTSLFFVGASKTFAVGEPGTLFLGINDDNAASNGGGFNVMVTFTPAP